VVVVVVMGGGFAKILIIRWVLLGITEAQDISSIPHLQYCIIMGIKVN